MTLARVTFATVLTMLRIVLVPVFGVLWASGELRVALAIFVVAAATDMADGFVARYFHQKSELGALLDPAADKLMLLVSYLVAVATTAVPGWLAALVIGRDAGIAFGAGLFKLALPGRYDPERWRPSRIGKYATFSHTLVIALALVSKAFDRAALSPWLHVVMAGAAVLTVVSTLQYFSTGLCALWSGASQGGSNVHA
jgi:cardiolipin synthase